MRRTRSGRLRSRWWLPLGAASTLVALLALYILELGNFHVVLPGEVYRSAQPRPWLLRQLALQLGLRSVINLRSESETSISLSQDRRAVAGLDVDVQGVQLSALSLPTRAQLVRLIDLLSEAEGPTLVHCRSGVDRTGLGAALARLLAGHGLDEARGEYGWLTGYPGRLFGSPLPEVLDAYEVWLAGEGIEHHPDQLRRWARNHYVPGYYSVAWDILDFEPEIELGSAARMRARFTNRSPATIPLSDGESDGVVLFVAAETAARDLSFFSFEERRGFARPSLPPGESVDVEVVVAGFPTAERYHVTLDLIDVPGVQTFADKGSPAIVRSVIVAATAPNQTAAMTPGDAPDELERGGTSAGLRPQELPRPEVTADALACPPGSRLASGVDWLGPGEWCEQADADGRILRTGPARFFARNGSVRMKGSYRLGHRHGVWIARSRSSDAVSLETYRDGVRNGVSLQWSRHGPLESLTDLRGGVADGRSERWWRNRRRLFQGRVRNGERSGEWTWWDSDGTLEQRGKYQHGRKHGMWTRWSPGGTILDESVYVEGVVSEIVPDAGDPVSADS